MVIFSARRRLHDILKGNIGMLGGLVGCHFVNDIYLFIIPAFLPLFIGAFALSFFEAGVIAFAAHVLGAFFQPVAGYITDLYSRRKMGIVAGFALTGVATFSLGFVPNYPLLITACLVLGLGLSVYHPQSTNFLTMYFKEQRGMALGIHGVGGSLGTAAAPVISGFVISLVGWHKAAFVIALPGLLTAVYVWWGLEEPTLKGGRGFFRGLTPPLLLLGLVYGLDVAVQRGLVAFLPTFYVEKGATISRAGLLTSVMLGAGLIAQPVGGMLYDRIGGKRTFRVTLIALSVAIVAFTQSVGNGACSSRPV